MTEIRIPKLLTVREVSKLTGLPMWRLYELIQQGKGPAHMKLGQSIRIPDDSLAKWIEEQSNNKKEAET